MPNHHSNFQFQKKSDHKRTVRKLDDVHVAVRQRLVTTGPQDVAVHLIMYCLPYKTVSVLILFLINQCVDEATRIYLRWMLTITTCLLL